ncbi:MAG: GNAT family N-acetyltransferase [Chloroflexota bacterium]|nr:GNAT family N-acetyltransferase [Chloroflexota bacterium]
MSALFYRGNARSDEQPEIVPLTPALVRDLRLPWLSRFNHSLLTHHLQEHPCHALWVPRTGEYIIWEPWRRRDDIANVLEVTARRGREAMLDAMLAAAGGQAYRLLLCADEVWRDHTKSWLGAGFSQVERIVFFRRDLRDNMAGIEHAAFPQVPIRRADLTYMDDLMSVDHDSFPWMWWNSVAEFEVYLQMSNVYAYVAYVENLPVGYASFTMYEGWAHLDRLAVAPGMQGRRLGAAQLIHALHRMRELGAASVALSTQENNTQSHRLYRAFGFKQQSDTMTFYGRELGDRQA